MGMIWKGYGHDMGMIWEWYGSDMGMVWEWYGSDMGMIWEWYGIVLSQQETVIQWEIMREFSIAICSSNIWHGGLILHCGKRLHSYGTSTCYSWANQRTKWLQASIATRQSLPGYMALYKVIYYMYILSAIFIINIKISINHYINYHQYYQRLNSFKFRHSVVDLWILRKTLWLLQDLFTWNAVSHSPVKQQQNPWFSWCV
jgi:hypothetical protein